MFKGSAVNCLQTDLSLGAGKSRKEIQMKFMDTNFIFSVRILAGINRYTS